MREESLHVNLVEFRGGASVVIDAEINKEGRFVLSGQDIGDLPKKHFRDSDYEYWVVVPQDQKDRVHPAFMKKLYQGDSKVASAFMELLKSNGLPYEYGSWT